MRKLPADFLVPGIAIGSLTLLGAPLSLWGGFDVHTGTVIDVNHPQRGAHLAGRIVAMREARGSSSSASALVEAARRGTAPSAIILGRPDPILVIGALVAFDLYRVAIPVVALPAESWEWLTTGANVRISSELAELIVD
jgi:uncharacterized protein